MHSQINKRVQIIFFIWCVFHCPLWVSNEKNLNQIPGHLYPKYFVLPLNLNTLYIIYVYVCVYVVYVCVCVCMWMYRNREIEFILIYLKVLKNVYCTDINTTLDHRLSVIIVALNVYRPAIKRTKVYHKLAPKAWNF